MTDDLPPFDLARFLPYRMTVVAERLSAGMAKHYREAFGISVAEWRVLVHIADAGDVSVREIHERVHLEKSKASRAASRLERSGYLKKEINEQDRRLVILRLTPEGTALMAKLLKVAVAYQAQLEAVLDTQEAALDAVLETLMKAEL